MVSGNNIRANKGNIFNNTARVMAGENFNYIDIADAHGLPISLGVHFNDLGNYMFIANNCSIIIYCSFLFFF